MSIHRVGGPGGAPPEAPPAAGRTTGARSEGAARFDAGRTNANSAAPVAQTAEVKPSAPLEQVRSGALDVNGYVDAKVAEATAHLQHLSPTQLHAVQEVVRSQLLSDPHLRDLVHHATGAAPPADEE